MDLFAGIGGFSLGLKRVGGFKTVCYVEQDKYCKAILERNQGEGHDGLHVAEIKSDVRDFQKWKSPKGVEFIVGGDPCPSRSLAKGNRKSNHPDLAGYFLAVVGRYRPRWVVRENVPSPDALHFAAAMEALRYGVVAFALDCRDFTSQSRRRQFIVGCPGELSARFKRVILDAADGFEFSASSQQEETPIAACLTAHPARVAAEDSYVYEKGRGLRVLSSEECESLQGFPRGWTAGFSRSRRRIMLGNAIPVPFAEWIGERIMEAEVS